MEKKFYMLVLEWAYDWESGTEICLFETIEEAQQSFKAMVQSEKENSWINGANEESLIINENEFWFEAYVEEAYPTTHTGIGIYPIGFKEIITI